MKTFDDQSPIYLQLREEIEKAIIKGAVKEDEMIPSTRILSQSYNLNQKTVINALSDLISDEILYKKRGIGIFVSPGSRKKLADLKKDEFRNKEIIAFTKKARLLSISADELVTTIKNIYEMKGE
jgi:GntR family transcriptional regulator